MANLAGINIVPGISRFPQASVVELRASDGFPIRLTRGFWPSAIDWWARATHHECRNPVCKHASFAYGAGFPTLWRHENLDDATHEWLKGEFAHVPMSFFTQMRRCVKAGHLVSMGRQAARPADFIAQAPRTDARFVFLAGERNECFRAESMARTFDFFERHAPGRHMFQQLAGYGHLDVFIGQAAATAIGDGRGRGPRIRE